MDITWYCDCCDAELSRQVGFNTYSGSWRCDKCGYLNDVTEDNILTEEEAVLLEASQEYCPLCGGHLRSDGGYAYLTYVCEECETELWYNSNGQLVFDE